MGAHLTFCKEMKNTLVVILGVSISLLGCGQQTVIGKRQTLDETTKIQRKVFTESGDWGGLIDYTYGQDGNLRHVSYEFSTFNGYDKATGDSRSTRSVRDYDISKEGRLILKSTITTDIATGKTVGKRTFYEPQINHWMTISEALKEIHAEQVVAPNGP